MVIREDRAVPHPDRVISNPYASVNMTSDSSGCRKFSRRKRTRNISHVVLSDEDSDHASTSQHQFASGQASTSQQQFNLNDEPDTKFEPIDVDIAARTQFLNKNHPDVGQQ
ncbi:hypothetical protein MKX03_028020, partial [Papaver bracteatum]